MAPSRPLPDDDDDDEPKASKPRRRDDDDDDYERPAKRRRDEPPETKRVMAGVLGILIGALGVHKFVLGYTGAGLTMLLVTLLTCGFGGMIMGVIGMVEGIIYLTKSDEQFYETYVENKKAWF